MSKFRYYGRRLVVTVVLIWAVATFLFLAFRLMPGDYGTILAGEGASPEYVEQVREEWGLNDPLYVQYYDFMRNLATGHAGESHVSRQPVFDYIGTRLANSMILVLPAILAAYLIGVLYGTILGMTDRPRLEQYGIIIPTAIGTTPAFFVGILLIIIFAGWFEILPVGGIASIETRAQAEGLLDVYLTTDFLRHYTLPFLTITISLIYYPTLVMRSSVMEVKNQEFTYYRRLLGLGPVARFKNTMKHASLPIITLLPASTATSVSGLVVIEWVFSWPGIGTTLFDSVIARDIPVLQVLFLIVAIWIILGNFLVDIFYTVIDPRITYAAEE